jgi:hypothetical protein
VSYEIPDYLGIAEKALAEIRGKAKAKGRTLGGLRVQEVIWETERMVIFRCDAGLLWRYVHSWDKAWPVEVVSRPQGAEES